MESSRKKLSAREELFCRLFTQTGNPREAAARAGYAAFPERAGWRLLEKSAIRKTVEGFLNAHSDEWDPTATSGLRRLAFGSTADALRLLFRGESMSEEEWEGLDLFSVAEIKKQGNGGMEIKFFDRIKALELLSAREDDGRNEQTDSFYNALERGAESLREERKLSL